MAEFYSRLARYYDTDENDPRIYKLTQKLLDKGIDPTQWIDAKIGKRTEPLDRQSVDPRQDTSSAYGNKQGAKSVDPASIKQGVNLPPTEDERLGIDSGLAEPGIASRAMVGAASPQQRRQFLRGVSDTATFGLAEKVGKMVDPDFENSAAPDQLAAPDARDYGGIAGSFLPGMTRGVAGATGKGIGALGQLGAKVGGNLGGGVGAMVGGGIGGAVGGAVSAPVVGGLVAGGQAAVDGPLVDATRAALEAAKATATDPLAMGGGVLLGGLGGVAKGIRSGDTRTGEDIRAVEEFGGKPSLLRGARGGAFEDPMLRNRRGTTEDVGQVAREAGDQIRTGLNARTDRIQREFGEGKRRLEMDDYVAQPDKGADFMARRRGKLSVDDQQPEPRAEGTSATRAMPRPNWIRDGQTSRPNEPQPASASGPMIDTSPIRAAAEQLLAGKRLPKGAKASIRSEVLDVLDELPDGRMSVSDLNDFRGKLQDISKVGEPTASPHFRTLYKKAKGLVDETEYGQLNATYSKGIEAQKRAHRQLGLGRDTSRTDIEDPIAAKKAARVVRRQGENTATSGQEAIDVQRFIDENPEFRQALAASRLLGAKGRLRLGMPDSGGLYERVGGLATRNIEPILGSGVYPVGNAVGGIGAATAPSVIRIFEDAMAQQRKRDEERSRMFQQ